MKSMSPWMVRVRSTAHSFVFIIGVSPTDFSRMLIFFLVSPTGSSVPKETVAEEGGAGPLGWLFLGRRPYVLQLQEQSREGAAAQTPQPSCLEGEEYFLI